MIDSIFNMDKPGKLDLKERRSEAATSPFLASMLRV